LILLVGLAATVVALVPLRDGAAAGWAVGSAVAGAVVAACGAFTAKEGRTWPAMGTRYERPSAPVDEKKPVTQAELWDALDRGEDPTR
jgi:uncharacterized membrane protein (TIGR02234 family)